MKDQPTALPLAVPEPSVSQKGPSTGELLSAVISQAVTAESVAVVKELVAMRREEVTIENKQAFNRDLFALKEHISRLDFYADKFAKTRSGAEAYSYCSEEEISGKLEPILFKHGFTMLFGQRKDGGTVTAIVTLIHRAGHEESREYSVRVGQSNQMKDDTAVDAGSTTSAWRHLVIKMFGLKSRIREEGDARNLGGKISPEKSAELLARCEAVGGNTTRRVLTFAMTESFEDIGEAIVPLVENLIVGFEKAAQPKKPADTGLADNDLFK